MLGAIIGDMVGSIYEFHPIKTKDFEIYDNRMRMTDDSLLTIEVANALMNNYPFSFDQESLDKIKKDLTRGFVRTWKMNRGAGFGGMFFRWCERADNVNNYAPPYNSYGNGSAMRISPVGWMAKNEEEVKIVEKPSVEAPRRGRGRPRKERPIDEEIDNKPKRGRGRPRKNPVVEEDEELNMMPGLEEDNSATLPGFEENDDVATLPGFEDSKESDYESKKDDAYVMPGVEEQDDEPLLSKLNKIESQPVNTNKVPEFTGMNNVQKVNDLSNIQDVDISRLLTADKKIACFVGTSKNGTSFIVNNLADITSKNGIDTAILDTTKNRNSYYIYTKNEEELRTVAMNSIKNLVNGQAEGIQVNKNLTVYTALPDDEDGIENAGLILETLLKKHSLILIDCDFETPITYFEKTQEIYLVQSYDILTIQPLTAFLRELKSKNVLDEGKLRIILNKALRLRGISDKTIIGGMAYYNDPAMSFMTELFDKNTIKYIVMPFNEEAYTRYLGNVINCEISTKGFPKDIAQVFTELSNVIYPVASGKNTYTPPALNNNTNNGFSASINSTLDEMRKKF